MEACADRIDQHRRQIADQNQRPIDGLVEKTDTGSKSLEALLGAVTELQLLVSGRENGGLSSALPPKIEMS
jgi:hypothetical protein